jgi:hypothetical protein
MKKFNFLAISFLITSVLLISCSKTETTDIRTNLTGTYTGNQLYTIQWSKVSNTYSDSTRTDPLTMTVANDNAASDGLIITELGSGGSPNFVYKANAVTAASNGATFNIQQQTMTISGISVTINGYSNYTLGTMKYDGGYMTSNKQITLGYTGTVTVTNGAISVSIPFTAINTCTKQ